MSAFSELFTPITLGQLSLPNRIMMAAVGINGCTPDGQVTPRLQSFLARRAAGGAGLIVTEAAFVRQDGREPGRQPAIDREATVEGLRSLATSIQEEGARAFVQLNHAGRQTLSRVTGSELLAPSPIACKIKQETPREISPKEIPELVQAFADAAYRARQAGFDGVELLAGHGHLVNQFLSPYTNHRQDDYGGSRENRMRFVLEIVDRIQQAVGSDYPLACRISAREYVEGGSTWEDTSALAQELVQHGVDLIHVSGGIYESAPMLVQPMALPTAFFATEAAEIKRQVQGQVPVAVVGRIPRPDLAQQIIAEGQADMIALGRPLLADPDWPRKARESRVQDIRPCIACNQGCIDRMLRAEDVTCLGNPECGREWELEKTAPAPSSRRVMVIGGGPGGMEAARAAAERGHRVTLCDKQERLGGRMPLAAAPPGKEDISDLESFLRGQLSTLGVEVETGREVDAQVIEKLNPEAVILATGSQPLWPRVPGGERENVVSADDVLSGRIVPGSRVLVVGGGLVGLETAVLMRKMGKDVLVMEMTGEIGSDLGPLVKALLLKEIRELGIEIYLETTLEEISEDGARVNSGGTSREFSRLDTIVMATGYEPDRALLPQLEGRYPVQAVGDAREVRKMLEAIHEGFAAAYSI